MRLNNEYRWNGLQMFKLFIKFHSTQLIAQLWLPSFIVFWKQNESWKLPYKMHKSNAKHNHHKHGCKNQKMKIRIVSDDWYRAYWHRMYIVHTNTKASNNWPVLVVRHPWEFWIFHSWMTIFAQNQLSMNQVSWNAFSCNLVMSPFEISRTVHWQWLESSVHSRTHYTLIQTNSS